MGEVEMEVKELGVREMTAEAWMAGLKVVRVRQVMTAVLETTMARAVAASVVAM